eukprot:1138820-Pelagomonas_calceolata.AAC.1
MYSVLYVFNYALKILSSGAIDWYTYGLEGGVCAHDSESVWVAGGLEANTLQANPTHFFGARNMQMDVEIEEEQIGSLIAYVQALEGGFRGRQSGPKL